MPLNPNDPLAAEIHNLTLAIEVGRACAQGIEDRRAARRWTDKAPGEVYSDKDLARFRRRDYDAVKRAKMERLRVGRLIERRAELQAELAARDARVDAWAADL